MSSLSNAAENSILLLIFNGTTWLALAENKVSGPYTDLYIGLHTGAPGEGGDQTTNEADYIGYARVAVPRTISGFTVSNDVASNAALITFGEKTGGADDNVTHFSIGTDASGTGNLIASALLTAPRLVEDGLTPQFAIGSLTVTAA